MGQETKNYRPQRYFKEIDDHDTRKLKDADFAINIMAPLKAEHVSEEELKPMWDLVRAYNAEHRNNLSQITI